jgi:hypothetical protein
MFNWLKEAITDSTTNRVSAKRVALLQASTSLSFTVIVLALSTYFKGMDITSSITATSIPLVALAGYSYVNGKANELKAKSKDNPDDDASA